MHLIYLRAVEAGAKASQAVRHDRSKVTGEPRRLSASRWGALPGMVNAGVCWLGVLASVRFQLSADSFTGCKPRKRIRTTKSTNAARGRRAAKTLNKQCDTQASAQLYERALRVSHYVSFWLSADRTQNAKPASMTGLAAFSVPAGTISHANECHLQGFGV